MFNRKLRSGQLITCSMCISVHLFTAINLHLQKESKKERIPSFDPEGHKVTEIFA